MAQGTIFILAGYRQQPTQRAYKQIALILKKQGFRPVPIPLSWANTTISANTDYFLKRYKRIRVKKKYILGFSFGAMVAFLASTKVSVAGLILCSLSPYFTEDLPKRELPRRYADYANLHFGSLSRLIKARQIILLYGSNEAKALIRRVNDAFVTIPTERKYVYQVRDTGHEIGNRQYLLRIKEVVQVLT